MSTDGRRLIAEMVSGVALAHRGACLGADSLIDLRGLSVPLFDTGAMHVKRCAGG